MGWGRSGRCGDWERFEVGWDAVAWGEMEVGWSMVGSGERGRAGWGRGGMGGT